MAERRLRPGRARCLAAGLALLLAGCMPQRSPVPEALFETANVPGYSGIRFWGDDADSNGTAAILAEAAESRTRTGDPHWYFLSISGGGSDGAIGAAL
jgi:hypothetical protein